MITIEIKDNTPAGISISANGVQLGCIQDITINCENTTPSDTLIIYYATVVHTNTSNGVAVAQVLKDHGFQVRVIDYDDQDEDGNPREYML